MIYNSSAVNVKGDCKSWIKGVSDAVIGAVKDIRLKTVQEFLVTTVHTTDRD